MFCPSCGNSIPDTTKFCTVCGAQVSAPNMAAPGMPPQGMVNPGMPTQGMVNPGMPTQGMVAPGMPPQGMVAPGMPPQGMMFNSAPMPKIVPDGKKIRHCCHACKFVSDVVTDDFCPNCKAPTIPGGYIKMYRMGSPLGVASPFGIYVDGNPNGYIGNKQTCWLRVPFGTHRLHIAIGANRNCEDVTVTVSPDHPLEAVKVYMKAGFWVNTFKIIAANPAELPD